MTLLGYDNSSFQDFEQPTIKSYIVSGIGESGAIFLVNDSITVDQFKEAEKIVIVLTDSSDVIISSPNPSIKIYLNLFDETEMDNTSTPFTFLLQSVFEFSRINR